MSYLEYAKSNTSFSDMKMKIKLLENNQSYLEKCSRSIYHVWVDIEDDFDINDFWGTITPVGPREEYYVFRPNGKIISLFANQIVDCKIYTLPKYRNKGFTRKFLEELYSLKLDSKYYRLPDTATCISENSLSLFRNIEIDAHLRNEEDEMLYLKKMQYNVDATRACNVMKEIIQKIKGSDK